jgi:hypothetical protein
MAAAQTSTQAASEATSASKHGGARANPPRHLATDDQILGISPATEDATGSPRVALKAVPAERGRNQGLESAAERGREEPTTEPETLRSAFDANPELRQAWQDAQAYRETFATPEEARSATALLADLDRMDGLFFSRRPEDHVALARAVADLDPAAFASLAKAMNGLATETRRHGENLTETTGTDQAKATNESASGAPLNEKSSLSGDRLEGNRATTAKEEFFHATNAAAVRSVLDAIESQVERLLPENASKGTRSRVVGEIYRELDNTLQSNRQLAQQIRDAFRSGALDADHQRAIVSLIAGRARQALPGVAKRVLSEWTSNVLSANQDRRARQRAAERRVDIAGSNGSGNEARRPTTPRDIDYTRMSDSDILNL